ncbi:hypothetical protein CBS101457_000915 [Exobasidium rhododendri]|nr:hypothetical protein CBS101457_000915 [Exobasidium rhododendri]
MTEQHVNSTPKSHVSFSQTIDNDVTPSARQSARPQSSTPLTPQRSSNDLPTPPSSHIEMASASRLPSLQDDLDIQRHASTLQEGSGELVESNGTVNESPSVLMQQRKVKRTSAGSTVAPNEAFSSTSTPPPPFTERQAVLAEAERGRNRSRAKKSEYNDASAGSESSRSRTPSPILGSMVASSGHLSFAASLVPSTEEVHALLYGKDDRKGGSRDEERPSYVKKDDMEGLLSRLASMGFSNVEAREGTADLTREEELAGMVKKLVAHARQQDSYMDSLEETLHDTRIRSISLLTSLRTTFTHTLASEYTLRARLEAELDGARTQAKKLSGMLARSEMRNVEIDRERAMSAEEEVLWQEEMKDHASAYAQQQAARARAAQMAQAQQAGGQLQKVPQVEAIKREGSMSEHQNSDILAASLSALSPPSPSPAVATLEEPFDDRKVEEASGVTGLGISSVAIEPVMQSTSSPLSTIVKERNKLLSDKRYLKSRMRDTEAQRDRLELELKNLRPLLVRGAPSKATSSASHAAAHTSLATAASTSTVPATTTSTATNATTPSLGHGPSTPGRFHKRDRSRRRKQATMGDAEAEHLLLAARRLRELNRQKYVDEDGRPKTPPTHATPSSTTQPRTPKTPRTAATMMATPRSSATGRDGMESVHQSGASSRTTERHFATNGSPLASRNNGASTLGRWDRHERVNSAMSGSGIEDLLQAAQTVLTPEKKTAHRQSHSRSKNGSDSRLSEEEKRSSKGTAAIKAADKHKAGVEEVGEEEEEEDLEEGEFPSQLSTFSSKNLGPLNESPKRRRVSSATLDLDRFRDRLASSSPDKRAAIFQGGRRIRTSTEGAEPLLHSNAVDQQATAGPFLSQQSTSALSALDLLADQAAASQQPSQSSDRSHSGEGETILDQEGEEGDVFHSSDAAEEEEDEEEEEGMAIDEEEDINRPMEGGIGSHYYPRGAYGHAYAQQNTIGPHSVAGGGGGGGVDVYRVTNQPGYTYAPLGGGALSSQGWPSQNALAASRNGIYAPRGVSPPSNGSRYPATYLNGPRITTGHTLNPLQGPPTNDNSHHHPHQHHHQHHHSISGSQNDQTGNQNNRAPQKGGNTSPDKRLPYVRWSDEEDQKLRKAIGEYGQRWESVARVVGTRSYHQCRQRYLLMRRKEAAAREGSANTINDDNRPNHHIAA